MDFCFLFKKYKLIFLYLYFLYAGFHPNKTMYRQFEDIEEIERLDQRNQELSRENAKLRKKNESRKLKKEELKRRNEELTRQNEELTRQVTELRAAAALPKKMKVCAMCGEWEREGVKHHAMTHPNSTFDLCQKCFDIPTMDLTIEELCEREQEQEREQEREREKAEIDSQSQHVCDD